MDLHEILARERQKQRVTVVTRKRIRFVPDLRKISRRAHASTSDTATVMIRLRFSNENPSTETLCALISFFHDIIDLMLLDL